MKRRMVQDAGLPAAAVASQPALGLSSSSNTLTPASTDRNKVGLTDPPQAVPRQYSPELGWYKRLATPEMEWGELFEPAVYPKASMTAGPEAPLRIVAFTSFNCGEELLRTLNQLQRRHPSLLTVVGVATDDPTDPRAKISLKKRLWSEYPTGCHQALKTKVIRTALTEVGVPCYTGAVKTEYFRNLYKAWAPDVLLMFGFGQRLDSFLFDLPTFGAYNFHPSDLAQGKGAGPRPFHDAIRDGLPEMPLCIHRIAGEIDGGDVVGCSPMANVRLPNGHYPHSVISMLGGGWE